MDKDDITGAKVLVRFLCSNGLRWLSAGPRPKPWCETFKAIGSTFSIYRNADIVDRCFLPNAARSTSLKGEINGPHILLEPPSSKQHIVCLLGISWALDNTVTRMTLYLHTFGESQLDGVKAWHRGYRFELPHRGNTHAYTHLQPVTKIGWKARTPIPFEDQSVPDSFPSFPVRGHNLTTLCAALAVALHGRNVLADVVNELKGNAFQTPVKRLLD